MLSEFEKEKVFWTRKMNLNLVKFIESRPNIWNPKHPKYTSIESRDQTYNEFASMYGNEFTGQAVKERWTNIRSTFANYLRKRTVNRGKTDDGEEFSVNWHLWEPCQFLLKVNRKRKARALKTELVEEERNDSLTIMQEDIEQNWSMEDVNDFYNYDDIPNSSCNAVAENLFEIFKKVKTDAFDLDNTKNCKIGRKVTKKLSDMNSYDAAKASQKIMDVLLLYDKNNPRNPNYSMKDETF